MVDVAWSSVARSIGVSRHTCQAGAGLRRSNPLEELTYRQRRRYWELLPEPLVPTALVLCNADGKARPGNVNRGKASLSSSSSASAAAPTVRDAWMTDTTVRRSLRPCPSDGLCYTSTEHTHTLLSLTHENNFIFSIFDAVSENI